MARISARPATGCRRSRRRTEHDRDGCDDRSGRPARSRRAASRPDAPAPPRVLGHRTSPMMRRATGASSAMTNASPQRPRGVEPRPSRWCSSSSASPAFTGRRGTFTPDADGVVDRDRPSARGRRRERRLARPIALGVASPSRSRRGARRRWRRRRRGSRPVVVDDARVAALPLDHAPELVERAAPSRRGGPDASALASSRGRPAPPSARPGASTSAVRSAGPPPCSVSRHSRSRARCRRRGRAARPCR